MFDLEDAIRHAEEVAEIKKTESETAEIQGCDRYALKCEECAEEHRQLAEWLRDYKRLKEQEPKTGYWVSDEIQGEIDGQIVKAFICSECGGISVFRITGGKIVNGDLCPNCGAKMIESQERSEE